VPIPPIEEHLTADIVLSPAIRYAIQTADSMPTRIVFLTGATGFLGANLLSDLLLRTPFDIICLVRAVNDSVGFHKITQSLRAHGLWSDDFQGRFVALAGDLTKPRLGLSSTAFIELGEKVQGIYHNAANVNLILPYYALQPTNVSGTAELLRLASIGPPKTFHHVSSLAVFGSQLRDAMASVKEHLHINYPLGLDNGYAQSKWVAERLATLAADRGLAVCIYRPGLITGHSRTGMCNPEDSFSLEIRACMELRLAPDLSSYLPLTPVDLVSNAIVDLSVRHQGCSKAFHIVGPNVVSWKNIATILRNCDYVDRIVPYSEWLDRLQSQAAQTGDCRWQAVAALLSREQAKVDNEACIDTTNAACVVSHNSTILRCQTKDALLESYFSYLSRSDS
jgi:thioester reductase-like protein